MREGSKRGKIKKRQRRVFKMCVVEDGEEMETQSTSESN
jgi:hypothetical protein